MRILNLWFEKRFNRIVNEKDSYYKQWQERFTKGIDYAWNYMDLKSRRIFIDTLENDLTIDEYDNHVDEQERKHDEFLKENYEDNGEPKEFFD